MRSSSAGQFLLPQALLLVFALAAWAAFAGPWVGEWITGVSKAEETRAREQERLGRRSKKEKIPFPEHSVTGTRIGLLSLSAVALALFCGAVRAARRKRERPRQLRDLVYLGGLPFVLLVSLTWALPLATVEFLLIQGDGGKWVGEQHHRYERAVELSPRLAFQGVMERLRDPETRHGALLFLYTEAARLDSKARSRVGVGETFEDLGWGFRKAVPFLPEYPYQAGPIPCGQIKHRPHGNPNVRVPWTADPCELDQPGCENCERAVALAIAWYANTGHHPVRGD